MQMLNYDKDEKSVMLLLIDGCIPTCYHQVEPDSPRWRPRPFCLNCVTSLIFVMMTYICHYIIMTAKIITS